jgi:hypothetical protein
MYYICLQQQNDIRKSTDNKYTDQSKEDPEIADRLNAEYQKTLLNVKSKKEILIRQLIRL